MTSRFLGLAEAGQAVWLDYLHRRILEDGELKRLIEEDGLKGMTSNPNIFEKAIGEGDAYDGRLKAVLAKADGEVIDLYEALAVADIQAAADIFRPLHDSLDGADGFVSLEVSPYLAMDTEATIAEARRLWRTVDRPNVMIKVPGTKPGVPAIRTLIGEGINVNVTLLFGLEAYLAVAEAHMAGLEAFKAGGGDIARVHGVASFFVSRIDGVIDKEIDARLKAGAGDEEAAFRALRGRVAIANAKIAYQRYLALIASPRWRALAAAGATPQRLLWASTGTKDPAFSDVLYVETLIGPDTVNTMPPATLAAFRDHGNVAATLAADVEASRRVLAESERLGLDLDGVTDGLIVEGVEKFSQAFDALLGAVAGKRAKFLGPALNGQSMVLPADLDAAMKEALAGAAAKGWTRRLWAKDASLWTGADESGWLGWLAAGARDTVDLAALEALRARAKDVDHALLLGMGGSSLGPAVLATIFGAAPGHPALIVLDSTDPVQVARAAAAIDPARTLFVISSKSGSTLEPDVLGRYFFDLAETALGAGQAGARFIAVTDPGSALEADARRLGFAHVFHGDPQIGGRYSVLSNFGMVPAAVLGLDVRGAFDTVATMARACGPSAPPAANPGFGLGALLGAAANAGRDKVTVITSPALADFGAWLEQLLAESTGKLGKGLIPVDAEPPRPATRYGDDRLFAFLRLDGEDEPTRDELVRDLEEAGQPVVRITLAGREMLFQEFFRWEVATAVAGAVIGIDPFDQPDVEASKVKARALTDAFETCGALPPDKPLFESEGVGLHADPANAAALEELAGVRTLEAWLRAHLGRAGEGDYIGLLAWLDRSPAHVSAVQALRARIGRWRRCATVLGFGPRFLHSTGQAYKGGPNSGVFLQITGRPSPDIQVPGRKISFGTIEAAQGRGDFEVLGERGRRILRVDLGSDIDGGLERLRAALDRALD
jgi:transaldolase / glucose-6-phosphate isomerase